jgi:ABC-2 type transport system ATP-binding protein
MGAIETERLRKIFPGDIVAVDGIDLDVHEGEIFGFLGPNGAGKTTTVRMLTTLARPTEGHARVAGFDVAKNANEVRHVIGVALQDAGLDLMATGFELLLLQARLYGMRGTEPARRAREMLELVGLSDAGDRRVRTYSGGMKRRLDLASALIHRPRVLFLDEPTAGLDPASRAAIWDEVERLSRADGLTVLLTTQYLEEADRLAKRVAIMDHGKIVAAGTPDALKASVGSDVVTVTVPPEQEQDARRALASIDGLKEMQEGGGARITLFLSDGSAGVAGVVRALDAAGVHAQAITVSTPTLDEVFLRATGSRLEGDKS